jgi:hypothetical protein
MEKKIYDRQISKQTMSGKINKILLFFLLSIVYRFMMDHIFLDRIVDEIQAENHFTRTQVEKLIHYVKEEAELADLSQVPFKFDDSLLINVCKNHANVITKEPFTHESLLIDKKEYQLSEREKMQAFREYQNDKKYFPYNRPNSYNLYNQQFPSNTTQLIQNQQKYSTHHYPELCSTNNTTLSHISNINMMTRPISDIAYPYANKISYVDPHIQNLVLDKPNVSMVESNKPEYQHTSNFNTTIFKSDLFVQSSVNKRELGEDTLSTHNAIQNSNKNSSIHQNLKDVKITSFISTTQIVIPTAECQQESRSITINPGEKVYILKTPKGGKFIKLNWLNPKQKR